MKTTGLLRIAIASSVLLVSTAEARNSMLSGVNSTCGTSYGCGLCRDVCPSRAIRFAYFD